jgi:hypothetical protein
MDSAADVVAIGQLQARYGDAVTRHAWAEVQSMFTPDCPVRLDLGDGRVLGFDGPAALCEFIERSVDRFAFFAFTLLNSVIDVVPADRTATARLYIRELRLERETQQWTTAVGLYRDRYVRDGDGWRFARRDYSTLARTGPAGAEVFAIPE